MLISSYELEPYRWATDHFADLDLGDVRRDARVITLGQAFATYPGRSLPQLFPRWSELKAAYSLFARPEATPEQLQASHRELVSAALQQPGTYLLPEDTTELSWAGRQPIVGLGPVGSSPDGQLGFLLHSTLALRWPNAPAPSSEIARPWVELLGLADQQYHVRQPRPVGEARTNHRARLSRVRESALWEYATHALNDKPDDAAVRWVRVCDRGADIYEFLQSCVVHGHGFVVRAARDRVVLNAHGQRRGSLFAVARAQRALGHLTLELRARPNQPARTAQLQVSATTVTVRAPQRPGHGAGSLPSLRCTVVRVWEVQAPKGVTPLEWILLCDGERTSFALACECVRQYATRWLCEEFHKALKTGLKVENLQLETGAALMAATAIQCVVALRLLDLRERVQQLAEAPAEQAGLSARELEVLAVHSGRKLQTVREVALALGQLGGHLNRKGDGLPGWQTLWRGWLHLQALLEGVQLARQLKKFR